MKLGGWGRYPVVDCEVSAPAAEAEARDLIVNGPVIARGGGRAYGDSALNARGTLVTSRFNHMLEFAPESGLLTCECGVPLDDILRVFVPRGYFPPVSPGTKFATVGGMIAADVHGKNHHNAGSFGRHVAWIDVMAGDGRVERCSAEDNADLFRHTLGGMGLTGLILRAAFKLVPIETAFVRQETILAQGLEEVMDAFERTSSRTYSSAWIDCATMGDGAGRAILYLGEHARRDELSASQTGAPLEVRTGGTRKVPFNLPRWTLNRVSLRAFNNLYFRRAKRGPSPTIVDYDRFFYPLDAVLDWNRLYGTRGLTQYQCVLPKDRSLQGITRILDAVSGHGGGSPLAVLKLLGRQEGVLSFPREGYTLALDFPASPSALALMDRLDEIVCDHGGHLYLAKDARVTAATLSRMQPNLEAFRAFRMQRGLRERFMSRQSARLDL